MLFLWFLGIFPVIFVLQKVRAHSESTNDDSSKEVNLLAEKYHRFKSPLRCLNIADQKIYYIHDLSRPTNCKMFDIKTKQELDGTWTVVPSRGGASFRPCVIWTLLTALTKLDKGVVGLTAEPCPLLLLVLKLVRTRMNARLRISKCMQSITISHLLRAYPSTRRH